MANKTFHEVTLLYWSNHFRNRNREVKDYEGGPDIPGLDTIFLETCLVFSVTKRLSLKERSEQISQYRTDVNNRTHSVL